MTTQTKDLLPCPFCGDPHPGHYEHPVEFGVVRYVICNTCGATCGDPDTLPEKTAYEAWNTRPAQPSQRKAQNDFNFRPPHTRTMRCIKPLQSVRLVVK